MKKSKLTQNWGLKIVSILFAISLWLMVVNINDPQTPQKFTDIPVKILNADAITDQNMVYEILDDTDIVSSVTVTAPRSVVESLDESDIIATADMNDLTSLNTISINFYSNRLNSKITSIKGSIDSVKVNIEDKKTVQLVLKTEIQSDVADGYIIGDVTTDQNLIRVSGPESIVTMISKAVAIVKGIDGFNSDISTNVEVKLFDEEGNEITAPNLTKAPESVLVKVPILEIKEIPINYTISGTPASGYVTTGVIDSDPESVVIAGKNSVLKNINQLDIPEDVLNVTGQSEDMVTSVNLKEYLPDNTILGDSGFSGKATVTVHIGKEETKEMKIAGEIVKISGVPEGYHAEIVNPPEEYNFWMKGLDTEVDAINENTITAVADLNAYMTEQGLTELTAGNYDVPLTFNFTDSVETVDPVMVKVSITKLEEE